MSKKLDLLTESEGYDDVLDLLTAAMTDSVCPGICMNGACDYTTEVEPDQDRGWCESCRTNTVKSALILAGLI
jgi:hypothetical protein